MILKLLYLWTHMRILLDTLTLVAIPVNLVLFRTLPEP